jgi:hypothetical protein
MYTHTHTHLLQAGLDIRRNVCMYICMYKYKCMHVDTYVYTHIHTCCKRGWISDGSIFSAHPTSGQRTNWTEPSLICTYFDIIVSICDTIVSQLDTGLGFRVQGSGFEV